ncbi:MAG: YigZ family protein [Dokdonella sp.]
MADRETLAAVAEFSQDIRKSRFFVQVAPVHEVDAAMAFIEQHSIADAGHNCWAYRIGNDYRFNDDGEPGGTAGRPILAAIEGQCLDGVVAIVSRWFGGIKLGAGGLMRAYGGSAAECLRNAPRIVLFDRVELRIHCEFAALPIVLAHLDDFDASAGEPEFDSEGAILSIHVPELRREAFEAYLADLTRGRALVEPVQST